jgi:hypothetical protein
MPTDEQSEAIRQFVESSNEKLLRAGVTSAEQSFGLGCALGIVPLGILVLILYIMGTLNLIGGLVAMVIGLLALIGILSLISSQARFRGIANAYQREVRPEIDAYLGSQGLAKSQFDALADQVLTTTAPLRNYLDLPVAQERDSNQE